MKYLKLVDEGTIFHDPKQNVTITGSAIVEANATPRIVKALNSNALVEVTEAEYEASKNVTEESKKIAQAELSKNADAKVAAVQAELEEAKKEVAAGVKEIAEYKAKLETAPKSDDVDNIKKENTELKSKVEDLGKQLASSQEAVKKFKAELAKSNSKK